MKKPSFEKGIYLLPNLMTTAALFAGFYAVIAGMQGQFEQGAIAIFVAMVFDGLDGRVARMTHSSSDFGAEYDSLSDMISFGLVPALLVYQWQLHEYGKLGWLIAFIYTVSAALRLARFNTQIGNVDKKYFQGLPSPAAAAVIAGLIWMMEANVIELGSIGGFLALVMTLITGLMMVSNIRYSSFKEFDLKNKVPFVSLLLVVIVFVVVTIEPSIILFLIFFIYAISGPVLTLRLLQQKRTLRVKKRKQNESDTPPSDNPPKPDESNLLEDSKIGKDDG